MSLENLHTLWYSASVSLRCIFLSNVVYWTLSSIGLVADYLFYTQRSEILRKCKLQNHTIFSTRKGQQTDELRDLFLLTGFNMLLISTVICCPLFEWIWDHVNDHRYAESENWNWQNELILKIPLHMLVTDMGFYSFHYLLHYSPFLYKNIHKVHHRFTAPTAMMCVYAHPIEFMIGNVFPVYLGTIITNAHPKTCYIWWCLAMLGTCKGHCGYRIFGFADYHDHHHNRHKHRNFGGMYLIDFLMGTIELIDTSKKWNVMYFCDFFFS